MSEGKKINNEFHKCFSTYFGLEWILFNVNIKNLEHKCQNHKKSVSDWNNIIQFFISCKNRLEWIIKAAVQVYAFD